MPLGATPGRIAAIAGLSNAMAVPNTATAAKIPDTVSQPARLPHAKYAAASAAANWASWAMRLRS
jgi:hypothetical protein